LSTRARSGYKPFPLVLSPILIGWWSAMRNVIKKKDRRLSPQVELTNTTIIVKGSSKRGINVQAQVTSQSNWVSCHLSPCLRSPDLVCAPRSSATRRNARRRTRRPVRCPRQPRQRPTLAAPSCARYRARQLKQDGDTVYFFNYLWLFCTRMSVLRHQELL